MDRDEFMELVYETFADEPDNVLANGIIEAADAYVEHEKAQLSQEGTTKDAISRQQAIDALKMDISIIPFAKAREYVRAAIETIYNRLEELPRVQPKTHEERTETHACDCISRQAAIDAVEKNACNTQRIMDAVNNLPTAQPEPQWIPVSERMPRDGSWNIFTDGKNISVERYKADAIDHFFPNGRWFQLEDVLAWMPLPEAYKPNK